MFIVSGLVPTVKLLQRHQKCIVRLFLFFPKKKDFKLLDSIESYWKSLTITAAILERRGFIQTVPAIPSVFGCLMKYCLNKHYYLPNLSHLLLSSLSKLSDPLLSSQSQSCLIRPSLHKVKSFWSDLGQKLLNLLACFSFRFS